MDTFARESEKERARGRTAKRGGGGEEHSGGKMSETGKTRERKRARG